MNILASNDDDKLLVFYLAIISGSSCGIMSVTTTVTVQYLFSNLGVWVAFVEK